MSLPVFDPQTHLFGLQARSSEVFSERDRYRLFASQIYPLLVEARAQLEACYCLSNGRPAVEPVLLLGVSVLQFLERVPDRQAVELVKYIWAGSLPWPRSWTGRCLTPACWRDFASGWWNTSRDGWRLKRCWAGGSRRSW
jgi:hypothetical protein